MSAAIIHIIVVVVIVVVVIVVVVSVVDVFVREVEWDGGGSLALEEVLDDSLWSPAEFVPATSHDRPTGTHSTMTMHEADDPHEREETNHDTVDELEVAEVRLQLCTAPTQPSPGIHNVTNPVKRTLLMWYGNPATQAVKTDDIS